jgi:hypothetical protein
MGLSTDALLWWGYCWEDTEDLVPDDEDGDRGDWEATYAAKMGLQQGEGEDFGAWYERKSAAVKASGVVVDSHCSSEYPIPLIAISESKKRAWRGSPVAVDSLAVDPSWPSKLAEFCRIMGITPPEGQEPRWWLASDMG